MNYLQTENVSLRNEPSQHLSKMPRPYLLCYCFQTKVFDKFAMLQGMLNFKLYCLLRMCNNLSGPSNGVSDLAIQYVSS